MATALDRLRAIARDMATRPDVIAQARAEGATWEQIAAALGMSRAGVFKLSKASTTSPRVTRLSDDRS